MDAGHWRSRVNTNTLFNEQNVHAQCQGCNRFKNGMVEEHRRAIVELYGEGVDEELYQLSKMTKRFTRDELEGLLEHYKTALKELENS